MNKVDCSVCHYKKLHEGNDEGHCYMFRTQVSDTCAQFKPMEIKMPQTNEEQRQSNIVVIEDIINKPLNKILQAGNVNATAYDFKIKIKGQEQTILIVENRTEGIPFLNAISVCDDNVMVAIAMYSGLVFKD